MNKLLFWGSAVFVLSVTVMCFREPREKAQYQKQWIESSIVTEYNGKIFSVPYLVYFPESEFVPQNGYTLIIALHGWNLRMEDWRHHSGISDLADHYGFLVVCPQMGKANYEKEYFPETIMKWNSKPSGRWIGEDFLTHIQKHYPAAVSRDKTGLLGVSTGAHGAVLVAGYYPERFGFAASLSGDFDVTRTPGDNLSRNIFGDYETYPDRWRDGSSISMLENFKNTRLFIAHGAKDTVATVEQSRLMADELKKRNYPYLYTEDENGDHSWNYWKKELKNAVHFLFRQ